MVKYCTNLQYFSLENPENKTKNLKLHLLKSFNHIISEQYAELVENFSIAHRFAILKRME